MLICVKAPPSFFPFFLQTKNEEGFSLVSSVSDDQEHYFEIPQDHRILVRTYFRLELPGMINTFNISHEHPFNIPHFA
jgi:hypothetical protein